MECDLTSLSSIRRNYGVLTVYGAGKYAKKLIEYFGKNEIEKCVDAFIVGEYIGNPRTMFSVPVFSVAEMPQKLRRGAVIIAVSSKKYAEILDSLEGIPFTRIIKMEEELDDIFAEESTRKTLEYWNDWQCKEKLFTYLEIETINRCNGTCGFCPVNANAKQRPLHMMEDELFYSIIDQLKGRNYNGKLALFSNNEPFLDPRIEMFAKYARENLQEAFIYIYTNGTLLNEERFLNVIQYLDKMQIDIYSDEKEIVPDNILRIQQIAKKENLESKMNYFRISKNAVRYSRGGNAPNSKVEYITKELCRLPLVQMVIRPDGKVSLCCNDALGEMTLGDVSTEKLVDIWYGEKYEKIRKLVMHGRENINICKYCNSIDRRDFNQFQRADNLG